MYRLWQTMVFACSYLGILSKKQESAFIEEITGYFSTKKKACNYRFNPRSFYKEKGSLFGESKEKGKDLFYYKCFSQLRKMVAKNDKEALFISGIEALKRGRLRIAMNQLKKAF